MQISEVKNTLTEWLDRLVYFKEGLIDMKSSIFHWMHSLAYELNIELVEVHVDEIATGENIIAITRNELGVAWQSLQDDTMNKVEDLQRLLAVYANEMKLLEGWQLKLYTNIELLFQKEFRMAS